MKVLVTHDHCSADAAARHCWTLVNGGWQARTVQRDGKHFVEVGAWTGMALTPRQEAVKIAEQVMQALDASGRGESHPLVINYMERSISERQRRAQAMAEARALEPQRDAVTIKASNDPIGPVDEPLRHGPGWSRRSD